MEAPVVETPITEAVPEQAPVAEAPAPPWMPIGWSCEGRPIEATVFGSGDLRIYLIGGIHGDENEGLVSVDALARSLSLPTGLPAATWRMVRNANPDGTAANTRGNANHRDLNRNWPARNFAARSTYGTTPLSEPETAAIHQDLLAFRPDVVIVFHSSPRGPFVNFDGPAVHLAEAFTEAARAGDGRWRVVPNMGYPTPGSLGSFIGVDGGVPILTIEFERGHSADMVLTAASSGVEAVVRRACTGS